MRLYGQSYWLPVRQMDFKLRADGSGCPQNDPCAPGRTHPHLCCNHRHALPAVPGVSRRDGLTLPD